MRYLYLALWLLGFWPLLCAWWINRRTSLLHALNWALAAWVAWGMALSLGAPHLLGLDPGRYLALCLTGAAGVAVLGARQPQAVAWNFVVLGLLAVLVLPLLESHILGQPSLGPLRTFFLGATLAVCLLNYLPTRFCPAVLLWALACAGEMTLLVAADTDLLARLAPAIHGLVLAIPWLAFLCEKTRPTPLSQFDGLWLEFRDHWGLFWAQRVRDQFNRAAVHAGWPAHLYWQGLALLQTGLPAEQTQDEMIAILRALLKRFRAAS
jgi:hypothetical protein